MKNQQNHSNAASAATDCESCPYQSTGFLCDGSDGECMKTRMQKIKNTSKKEGGIHG